MSNAFLLMLYFISNCSSNDDDINNNIIITYEYNNTLQLLEFIAVFQNSSFFLVNLGTFANVLTYNVNNMNQIIVKVVF